MAVIVDVNTVLRRLRSVYFDSATNISEEHAARDHPAFSIVPQPTTLSPSPGNSCKK
jgi:hypothetical protein